MTCCATNNSIRCVEQGETPQQMARHREIARRYAWIAEGCRQRCRDNANPARLMANLRLGELERIFTARYGDTLPYDDAGLDDFIVVAHHIAHLGGEIEEHIVAWASLWLPQMPQHEAERWACEVKAKPRKWRADTLAWRLRLRMTERTTLGVTTIGAFDMSKADREAERRRKRRDAERERRARNNTGRPRGRPKNGSRILRGQQVERNFTGHGISAHETGLPAQDGYTCAQEVPQRGLPTGNRGPRVAISDIVPRCFIQDQIHFKTAASPALSPVITAGIPTRPSRRRGVADSPWQDERRKELIEVSHQQRRRQ
jgi:hypothetical protein